MKFFKKIKGWTVILCIVCMGLGACIPTLLYKTTKSQEEQKFEKIYETLQNDWYFSKNQKDLSTSLLEQAIQGMTSLEEDPHTNYFTLKQAKQFQSSLDGSTVGLGFSYYENEAGNIVVTTVYLNSAAEQAGLQRGDEITAIDTVSCQDGIKKVIKYIQSKENQSVLIKFNRDGKDKMVKAKPSSFDSTVALEIFDSYGFVSVNSFSSQTGEDFSKAMKRLSNQGIHKVIIDLRNNTGGYLSAAVDVASSLLPSGSVVLQEKSKDGSTVKRKCNQSIKQVKMDQIVLLQNESTASASEALIGALKEQLPEQVTTVGTTTYGKGTEQEQLSFKDGTSMKYTVGKWYTPKGKNINKKGFTPDIEVDALEASSVSYEEFEKSDVIQADTVATNAKALQIYLDYLGYLSDRKDEYFSPSSAQALQEFQSDQNLEATGNCDYKTWKRLVTCVNAKIQGNKLSEDPQYLKAIECLQS